MYTLLIWAFVVGVANHGTSGSAASTTQLTFADRKSCDDALKEVAVEGIIGTDPFALYRISGKCVANTVPLKK